MAEIETPEYFKVKCPKCRTELEVFDHHIGCPVCMTEFYVSLDKKEVIAIYGRGRAIYPRR